MRNIIYAMMVSLDGFMEGPNGELAWSEPGPELHKHFNDLYLTAEIDTSLYGRRLYEIMASYWPTVNEDSDVPDVEKEFARIWKKIPKTVYSTTLDEVHCNARLARKVDPDEIRLLKQQPGNKIEVGGAGLASVLMKHGLVDEFWLYIHPVILGAGKPFFPGNLELKLKLVDTLTFPCKVVRLRYERAD